jgi:hypothetical protein
MKKTLFNATILSLLLCCAIIPFAGCDTGSSNDADTPNTDTPADPDAPVTSGIMLDFESANIATIKTAGGIVGDVGDMNATWGVSSTATSDMAFAVDTANHDTGSASLKVTATVLQNKYAPTVAQWAMVTDFAKSGLSAPVDLTGKTVSIKALVPASGSLSSVKLVFIDSSDRKSQGKEVAVTSKDTWTEVTYKYVDGGSATSDYTVDGFEISKVKAICVVAILNGASGNSSQTLYIDSLDWK